MLSGIYSAASGLLVAETNLEIVANNLAHLGVPGFRKGMLSVETFENALSETGSAPQGHGSVVTDVVWDFSPGPVEQTGRKLDVAIDGDGFFVVQSDDGPLYTRNGVFQVAADGQLSTSDGRAVMGNNGPIRTPNGTLQNQVNIATDGGVSVDGVMIGRLKLVRFEDNAILTRVGTTFFSAPSDAVVQEDGVRVRSGAREQSNVTAVDELVQMIVSMRYHEAAQRALKAIDSALRQNTNPGG